MMTQMSRCFSNYTFIRSLTSSFNELGNDNCKTRRESSKFWDSLRLILDSESKLLTYANVFIGDIGLLVYVSWHSYEIIKRSAHIACGI